MAKTPGKTREGMKRLLIPVPPDLHKRLKMLAASQDTTLEAIIRVALEGYVAAYETRIA
jgi:predicted transcriptional regulator